MFKPTKLKLNKFVEVAIPRNSEFLKRMGGNIPQIPTGAYTGDEFAPATSERNTDILADMEAYDKMMQRKELADKK